MQEARSIVPLLSCRRSRAWWPCPVLAGWRLRPGARGEEGPLRDGDEVRSTLRHRQWHPQIRDVRTDAAAEQEFWRRLPVRMREGRTEVCTVISHIYTNVVARVHVSAVQRSVRVCTVKIEIGCITSSTNTLCKLLYNWFQAAFSRSRL